MKEVFPNTKAHIIIGVAGAAPSFIRSLVENFYYKNLLDISFLGDAHNSTISQNWVRPDIDLLENKLAMRDVKTQELFVNPIDENKPLILMTHNNMLDCNFFFNKYPLGKLIHIDINNPKSFYRIQACFLIKSLFQESKLNKSWATLACAKLLKKHSFALDEINIDKFSLDELKLLITDEFAIRSMHNYDRTNLGFRKYKDKVLTLNYTDIIEDKNQVLHNISEFLNEPINENTIKSYDEYLLKQNEVILKYAPWILEFEANFNQKF